MSGGGGAYAIGRAYRDFKALHAALSKSCPSAVRGLSLPAEPTFSFGRSLGRSESAEAIERRTAGLTAYLSALLLTSAAEAPELRAFLDAHARGSPPPRSLPPALFHAAACQLQQMLPSADEGEEGASGGGVPLSAWFDVSARSAVARRAGCSLLMQLVPTAREEGEEAALGAGSGFRLLLLARAQAPEERLRLMKEAVFAAAEFFPELELRETPATSSDLALAVGGVCD